MFTNCDSVQFQFDKKNGQLLTTIMHNVFDIKRNFHGWHSTPTDNLAAIFFCSARRYRLSFKQRYQPTNKKKWFFHIPRQAMSTPNDLCLFALRHWMSSAHFFLLLFIFTSLLSCPTFIRPRFCWFTENLLSPCVGVIPHNPPQQKGHSVVVAVFWCCKNAHTYFIITFCMVDSQILRSLILRRLCKLNSILIVIKLNARLFICCFSLHTVYVWRGIQL